MRAVIPGIAVYLGLAALATADTGRLRTRGDKDSKSRFAFDEATCSDRDLDLLFNQTLSLALDCDGKIDIAIDRGPDKQGASRLEHLPMLQYFAYMMLGARPYGSNAPDGVDPTQYDDHYALNRLKAAESNIRLVLALLQMPDGGSPKPPDAAETMQDRYGDVNAALPADSLPVACRSDVFEQSDFAARMDSERPSVLTVSGMVSSASMKYRIRP